MSLGLFARNLGGVAAVWGVLLPGQELARAQGEAGGAGSVSVVPRIHQGVWGPEKRVAGIVNGAVVAGPEDARWVVASGRDRPELWKVDEDGSIKDTGYPVWLSSGRELRVDWEGGVSGRWTVVGKGAFPWKPTGARFGAFRLSDWLIASGKSFGLPFLGGENIAFTFKSGAVVTAEKKGGGEVGGRWWWSRGLLHLDLDGFSEVATYDWRSLARHVGWEEAMKAPVQSEPVVGPRVASEESGPPPRSLPGAAAACRRDVLARLLRTAIERSDVVTALGIEKETLALCRDRQKLVAEIVEADRRIAEAIGDDGSAEAKEKVPGAVAVKTVAQLASVSPAPSAAMAQSPYPRRSGDELRQGARAESNVRGSAPGGNEGPGREAVGRRERPASWSWFSMIGRSGKLVAGVTDGLGSWFVSEGDRLPGGGLVKRISARPPVVEVSGAGMLSWRERPVRGVSKEAGRGAANRRLRVPEPVVRPLVKGAIERAAESVVRGVDGLLPGVLRGRADPVDGDTLKMGDVRIRLWGIDAPESRQVCRAEGLVWNCGGLAMAALRSRATDIECRPRGRDGYGRLLAVCFNGGADVNAWMVSEGWALAYRKYSQDYVEHEEQARTGRKGMHRGRFVEPWEWRSGARLDGAEGSAEGAKPGDGSPAGGAPRRGMDEGNRGLPLPPLPGSGGGR